MSTTATKIRVGLNGARTRAALSTPPGAVTELDADTVERLLWQLSGVREAMSPPRPDADPPPGTPMAGGPGMRWYVEPGPEADSINLAIHHPGLGWVALTLDSPGADALVDAIGRMRRGG